MKKHQRIVRVDVHGAVGSGHTQAEAKADAIAQIETAFAPAASGVPSYTPHLTRFPNDEIGLVYRELNGWHYQIMWADQADQFGVQCGTYESRNTATIALRRHMAHEYLGDAATHEGLDIIATDDHDGRGDHRRWLRFQHAYAALRAEGLSAGDCHQKACEAMWAPSPCTGRTIPPLSLTTTTKHDSIG